MGRTQSWNNSRSGATVGLDPTVQLANTAQANINTVANTAIAFNAVAVQNTSPATFTPTVTGVQCNITGLYLCHFSVPVYNGSAFGTYGDLLIQWRIAAVVQANPRGEYHIPGGKNETPDLEGILSVVAGQIIGVNSIRSAGGGGQALPTVANEGVLIVTRIQ